MLPYFEITQRDRDFYGSYLKGRLPKKIFDIHVHLNTAEHIRSVPESCWTSDWALEAGHLLPIEDAFLCSEELYPGTAYRIAGFPWPIREADLAANNAYLSDNKHKFALSPFMCVMPGWDPEEVERSLINGGFVGFKPYPDMVSGSKGADISIFAFLPHEQWRILDKHGKAVMLHLPRKNRLASKANVRELMEARQRYADVRIIIAHFGRAFCPIYLQKGLARLRDWTGFCFDTAAVISRSTYRLAFEKISKDSILYGSEMPILFLPWKAQVDEIFV